jgi:site-specific DNA recombinase
MKSELRFISYLRKSTKGRSKQVLSIQAQKHEIDEYVRQYGINVVAVYIETQSARKSGRSVFAAMLNDLRQGKGDAVLAWHPNRLSRNSRDSGDLLDMLDQGIIKDFKFKNYWFENTPQGKLMLAHAFAQAKYEVEELSVGLKRTHREKLRAGVSPSIRAPGYMFEKRTRTYVPDLLRAPFVAKAFSMIVYDRLPADEVRIVLTGAGFLRQNGDWYSRSSFYSMLHNPVYYGVIPWRNELHLGKHQALITKDMFDRAQSILLQKKRRSKSGRAFLYRGVFQCAHCGCAMTSELHKTRFRYVRCTRKRGPCAQVYIREEKLRQQVASQIQQVILPRECVVALADESRKQRESELQRLGDKHAELTVQAEALHRQLETLVDLLLLRTITDTEFKPKRAQIVDNITRMKAELDATENKLQHPLELDTYYLTWLNKAVDLQTSFDDAEKLSFLKIIGSNLQIDRGTLTFSLKKPWDVAAEWKKKLAAIGPSPFSQDTNWLLCRFLNVARTQRMPAGHGEIQTLSLHDGSIPENTSAIQDPPVNNS